MMNEVATVCAMAKSGLVIMSLTYNCLTQCPGRFSDSKHSFEHSIWINSSMNCRLCGSCDNGTITDCFKEGCITANGMPRTVMTVNRQIPGPIISCCKNDRIIVDVTNNMAGQELSFHWHGLHQKGSPWFDGVPMVTQCSILSGTTFRYIFNASEKGIIICPHFNWISLSCIV